MMIELPGSSRIAVPTEASYPSSAHRPYNSADVQSPCRRSRPQGDIRDGYPFRRPGHGIVPKSARPTPSLSFISDESTGIHTWMPTALYL